MPANITENFQTGTSSANISSFQAEFDRLRKLKENKDKEFNVNNNGAMIKLLRDAKAKFKRYVESSGNDNGEFAMVQTNLDKELDQYDAAILNDLIQLRKNIINSTDINKKMDELTQTNQDLEKKKRDLQDYKDNYTTAQVRNTALITHGEAVSYQQTWGIMQRPIKKQTIPVLLVFTLLFLYLGFMGIYYISPLPALIATAGPIQLPGFGGISTGTGGAAGFISDIMQSPVMVTIAISSAIILGLILILKILKRV